MTVPKIHIGDTPFRQRNEKIDGGYVNLSGEKFYRISGYDLMPPFFISLVSHDDHWLFISSTGGLTAGRKDENSALFPYYTEDKIAASAEFTGSKTLLRVRMNERLYLWEPFSSKYQGVYRIRRNLYKNFAGNKIIFEEINGDLKLIFRYSWQFSEKYGIVKRAELENNGTERKETDILDGIQNILPYGVGAALQNETSNLVNAYKKNELHEASGLGIFTLSAMIVDKAEPAEALKATTVWSAGLPADIHLLSSLQLDRFRHGEELDSETEKKAEPGAYFIKTHLSVEAGKMTGWYIAAEVNQDQADTVHLINRIEGNRQQLVHDLESDILHGTQSLLKLVAKADGLQLTADKTGTGRHYANVLFNIMRGGVFEDGYLIRTRDLEYFAEHTNPQILTTRTTFFASLDESTLHADLIEKALKSNDPDLIRICYEYLPLSFSRRHGDPSRPWNKFSIRIRNQEGERLRHYEGNWRDIFQNWEALAISFPGFINSFITRFVNASTIDGYNPYRITGEGIDWEVIEPDNPWSFIGYWGDHQIIYLLKLMELAENFYPGKFRNLLPAPVFVYANVPYRIRSYADIVNDPKSTIHYDEQEEREISRRTGKLGTDGKLVLDAGGNIIRASLTEKILVTLLTKLYNFIPQAGIWLNTQRPEWNDANNALVGNGTSMVTLYYMRRFIGFCLNLFNDKVPEISLHEPVAILMKEISTLFDNNKSMLEKDISGADRKHITDRLGKAGEQYRRQAYAGFDGRLVSINIRELRNFLKTSLEWIDHSVRSSKRPDGLYHAYNLIEITDHEISVTHLYEMLEGQVAALSSGLPDPAEALEILDTLKAGPMYRPEQYSYMLYPDRNLPGFLEKNQIPETFVEQSDLAKTMLRNGNTSILNRDENGNYHFNSGFKNAADLKAALNALRETDYAAMVKNEYRAFLDAFEEVFNHRAFTGRSGTFFGYEGLGSIYWHMVSKLLLAVQENIYHAVDSGADRRITGRLIDHYYEIRAGIGINKSPGLYGSFPTDPYSHTPAHRGAQQPGMTGQVKEDIINRWAELGVRVQAGQLSFEPAFLNESEFLRQPQEFSYFDEYGNLQNLKLNSGELAFTFNRVPVIYAKSKDKAIEVVFTNGKSLRIAGNILDAELSGQVFSGAQSIRQITAGVDFSQAI